MNKGPDFRWRDGVSLKEYIESRLADMEKATKLALANLNSRFDIANEFRSSLSDQATRFVTRPELDRILEDIRMLRESKANLEGKASQQSVNVAMGIALLGLLLGAMGLIVTLIRG